MAEYTYRGDPGSFKIESILDDLITALAAYQVVPYVQGKPDGSEVVVGVPDGVPQSAVDAVIAAHDPNLPSLVELDDAQRRAVQAALDGVDVGVVQQSITQAADVASLREAALELADVVFNLLALARR